MTSRQRRNFDIAFNLQLVQMIRDQGLSAGQVCRDLDLVDSVVRRWLAQYQAEQAGKPVQGRPLTPSSNASVNWSGRTSGCVRTTAC
ncbi:transposase [Xanthomonas translucens pv. poae]|uniref:transposase n=1 Tax=Xanthomonas graminis TaxID=3390026 RepID=UPI0009C03FD2|nr:transposase [Xanthomonas translucens]UKE63129.1 transposase [Xanthomonas translucens pv. poae]